MLPLPYPLSKKPQNLGFTLLEIIIVIGIIMLLAVTAVVIINPAELQKRARDSRRISDLQSLDRAINEYLIDNNTYPDLANTTRTSITLPSGNSGPYELVTDGWIDVSLHLYIPKLPIDPINDDTYYYSFRHNNFSYELNARMEFLDVGLNTKDGGNNNDYFEMGTDLTVL